MSASNFLEDSLLDHVLGEGARDYTPPTLYVGLFTGPASDVSAALETGTMANTAGNWGFYEVSTGGYVRQSISFNAASGGSATSTATVTFPQATADYDNPAGSGSTVTYVAIIDQVDDGSSTANVLFYGALTNTKEILNGDQLTVPGGSLTVSLA